MTAGLVCEFYLAASVCGKNVKNVSAELRLLDERLTARQQQQQHTHNQCLPLSDDNKPANGFSRRRGLAQGDV